ncbi:unnamed protein product, partial [Mesorhabditis belari]|uniref:Uncharacterized protein n=1 Tax=Mesorhabditis belari TaxID=2138241 RepID=A0AAF3FQ81_9BILA
MSYTTQNAEPEQSEQHQENNWHFGVPNNSRSVGVEPDDPIGQVGLNENVVSYSIPVVFGRSASALQTFRMIVERSIRDIFPDIAQQIQVQTRLREPGNPIIGSIVVHLPGQENPVVDSPAIERVNMIQEHLSHIEAFLSVTAEGFSDLVDSILNGAAKLDPESEREQRKTLVNWVEKMQCVGEQNVEKNCNWVANGESSNENGRMQQLGTSQNETGIRRQNETQGFEGQPQYQIRHGLATDLLPMIESLVQLNTLLAPHLIRMSRVVRHNDNFDIGTQETLLTDSRANCLTVYLEQLQKTIHRHSHVLHLVSDLNIHFDDPTPRRLFPQYSRYRAEPSAEGELVFDVYLESDENSTNTSQTSAFNALTVPYEGRPDRPFLSSIASPFGTGPYREGMMVPIGMGIQISAQPPVAHQNPSGSSGSQNSNTSIPPQAAQPPPGITINRTGNPGGGLSSLISSVIQNAMTRNIPRTTMINVAGPLSRLGGPPRPGGLQPTQQVPLMVPTPNHQHLHNHNLHHFSAHHIGHHPMMSLGAPNRQNGNNSAQQQQTRNSTPLQPPVAPLHNQQNVIDFPREAQLQRRL